MPTIAELGQLYNSDVYGSVIRKTGYAVWSSETRGSEAAHVAFFYGLLAWAPQSANDTLRALPVRSGK